MKLKFCLLIIGCFISAGTFAQTPKAFEAELSRLFSKIGYWSEHQNDDTASNINLHDSVPEANKKFKSKLEYYTKEYPFTFDQNFNSIEGLKIIRSSDNMLKVYSWDDECGGTMRNYLSVIQLNLVRNYILPV